MPPLGQPVIPNDVPMPQPMMQMPMPQAMPTAMPTTSSAPVIPPVPQTGIGTPYPMAPEPPVIPAMAPVYFRPSRHDDPSSSSDSSSLEDMQPGPGPPLPPMQYGTRNFVFERPQSIVFHHHPLPPPPEDVFEHSPNMRILEDLRRPVEEVLARSKVATTGFMVTPGGAPASRERKKRKGLFHTISRKLTGRSKHDDEEPRMAIPVVQPVVFAATSGIVQPSIVQPGVVPSPGYFYDPAHMIPGVIPPPGETMPGAIPVPMFGPVVPPLSGTPAPPLPPKGPASPSPSRIYSPRQHSPRPHSPRAHSPRPYSPRPHSPRSHSPRRHEPLRIDIDGPLADLTHISPHRVHFNNRLYPTVLHALEAQRFVDSMPDIVDEIAACQSPDDVRAVVSHNSSFTRPDWEQIVVQMVRALFHPSSLHV